MAIHPTAVVSPDATVPASAEIGPFCVLEAGVVLGEGCRLIAHATLRKGTRLAARVTLHPGAVVGGEPQDLRFDPAVESFAEVGEDSVLRENSSVHRATRAGEATRVGTRCFLMAGAHVAHDCVIGDQAVLANQVLLAGFVTVGPHSFIGGGAAVHQFCRIGESVMVGGIARIAYDIPPYLMASERNLVHGLNIVGLRRRGVPRAAIAELKECFRRVYGTPGNIREVAAAVLREGPATDEARRFLTFFTEGKRGFCRPGRGGESGDSSPD